MNSRPWILIMPLSHESNHCNIFQRGMIWAYYMNWLKKHRTQKKLCATTLGASWLRPPNVKSILGQCGIYPMKYLLNGDILLCGSRRVFWPAPASGRVDQENGGSGNHRVPIDQTDLAPPVQRTSMQWRIQGGATGGHGPPQTMVKFFFTLSDTNHW